MAKEGIVGDPESMRAWVRLADDYATSSREGLLRLRASMESMNGEGTWADRNQVQALEELVQACTEVETALRTLEHLALRVTSFAQRYEDVLDG